METADLAPTEFRAKNALLPAEQRLEILREPEVDTKRVTPRCPWFVSKRRRNGVAGQWNGIWMIHQIP